MLIQFRFQNFKSFKDETILDLSAGKAQAHKNSVIEFGNSKLLPVAAIYGANASGKSNLLEAFNFMRTYVLESFGYGDEKKKKQRYTPFMSDTKDMQESLFEVYFVREESGTIKYYNYGFTLGTDGVVEEWYGKKPRTGREYRCLFYRNTATGEYDLQGLRPSDQDLIRLSLNKETLIVSLGAKLKMQSLKIIRDWFDSTSYISSYKSAETLRFPADFLDDIKVRDNVVKFLATFDNSIVGFNQNVISKRNNNIESVEIESVHRLPNGETIEIPLTDESDGTLKMLSLYPVLHDVLNSGGILFIDELDARLHPLLCRNIIVTFSNQETNPYHAQIIFTTHDVWQIYNGLLRHDEIWFVNKNDKGMSTLYSLIQFRGMNGNKVRMEESIGKNYLLGKYSAIPVLHPIDMIDK